MIAGADAGLSDKGQNLPMTYRVLARSYRSQTFDEVVGQDAVATTLKNAITSGRIHHGYLFNGTRGVGKTSMARILAKALNCFGANQPTITPCLTCESCRLIAEGEDVDVIEIDGASTNGVDDIRELRGNATLRPARSRYKVYIIDEVHMLSRQAFNALLKTLEEPPTHVKFIFATTEPEKLLDTIKSRCQRFDFQAIGSEAIAAHLRSVLAGEGVQADDDVVQRIARLANGSMRDALSLLDKVLSFEGKHLTSAVVDEIIPPPHDELAAAVFLAVARQDAAGAMTALDQALQSGRTVERFCDQLIEHVRTLMLMNVCGRDTGLVDVAGAMRSTLAEQAKTFDAPTYVYMINLLEGLRRAAGSSGAARALADAAMVRLAMTHQFSDIRQLVGELENTPGGGDRASLVKKNATPAQTVVPSRSPTSPVPTPAPRSMSPVVPVAPRPASETPIRPEPGDSRPPDALSSEVRQRVMSDPLVQRVRQAVDGTLINVRTAHEAPGAEPEGMIDDDVETTVET